MVLLPRLSRVVLGAALRRAATGPLYDVKATWGRHQPARRVKSAGTAEGQFVIQARNIGDAAAAKKH